LNIVNNILKKHPDFAEALLLKGKIQKAQKTAKLDETFNKALNYYRVNEFEKSRETFSLIDAGYSKYQEVKKYIAILDKIPLVQEIYPQAIKDFNQGNIEKSLETIRYILKTIPEYKPASELLIQLEKINQILIKISDPEIAKSPQIIEDNLNEMLNTISDPQNFYYNFAKKKLKELTTGKNLKSEMYYCKGIKATALRKYETAYENFKNAYKLTPNVLKIKISFTEAKQKRQKLLSLFAESASLLNTNNPIKAKYIWKKIVAMGEEENDYYKTALEKLQD
jgi:tetratricopeptide (TPR) repeat protein